MSKNSENQWKLMKIDKIDGESLHAFWTTWKDFNENFRKEVTYANIKSHKKPGVTPSLEDKFLEGGIKEELRPK